MKKFLLPMILVAAFSSVEMNAKWSVSDSVGFVKGLFSSKKVAEVAVQAVAPVVEAPVVAAPAKKACSVKCCATKAVKSVTAWVKNNPKTAAVVTVVVAAVAYKVWHDAHQNDEDAA